MTPIRPSRRLAILAAALTLCTFFPEGVPANPRDGIILHGQVEIEALESLLEIRQSSHRAVIDWEAFSIDAGEITRFIQPGGTSAALNTVRGVDPSAIHGLLQANGQIWLLNPNGILVGPGGRIEVGGLVASTLGTSTDGFLAGEAGAHRFSGESAEAVINLGTIGAAEGDIFLLGARVVNQGTLSAPAGTVGLGAGNDILLQVDGDEKISVLAGSAGAGGVGVDNSGVIEAAQAELVAHGGNHYAIAIRNSGRIDARGAQQLLGRVILRSNGGSMVNSGEVKARQVDGSGGAIVADAGLAPGSRLENTGRIDARGETGNGGQVTLTADRVDLGPTSSLDVSGATNGGILQITGGHLVNVDGSLTATGLAGLGGTISLQASGALQVPGSADASGQAGGGSLRLEAESIEVPVTGILRADALDRGNGGTILVLGRDRLDFQGSVSATGGLNGGDGGFAELSANREVVIGSLGRSIDLSAPQGTAGTLLIDPVEITIEEGSGSNTANTFFADNIVSHLGGGSLIIETAAVGDLIVKSAAQIVWNSGHDLTLRSLQDLMVETGVVIREGSGGGSISLEAARSLEITGATVSTSSGDITLKGNRDGVADSGSFSAVSITNSTLESASGNLLLSGAGGGSSAGSDGIYLDASTVRTAAAGTVTLLGEGGKEGIDFKNNASVTSAAGTIRLEGRDFDGSGQAIVATEASIQSTGGSVEFLSHQGTLELEGVISGATVRITGSAGDDQITLSEIPAGLVLIDGQGGTDVVDLSGATGPVRISVGVLTGIETFRGSGAEDTLLGTAGADDFKVGAADEITEDEITASGITFEGFESIEGLGGDDGILFANGGTLTGRTDGGADDDTITIDDTGLDGGPHTYTISADLISRNPQYHYTGVEHIVINLGDGANTINAQLLPASQHFKAGSGFNVLNVQGDGSSSPSDVSEAPPAAPAPGTVTYSTMDEVHLSGFSPAVASGAGSAASDPAAANTTSSPLLNQARVTTFLSGRDVEPGSIAPVVSEVLSGSLPLAGSEAVGQVEQNQATLARMKGDDGAFLVSLLESGKADPGSGAAGAEGSEDAEPEDEEEVIDEKDGTVSARKGAAVEGGDRIDGALNPDILEQLRNALDD